MSQRDWSTIGAGASLPRWIRWTIPPVVLPLAAIAWIAAHWDEIPPRFGNPLTDRTPLHVFAFPIFAAGMAALMVALALCTWYGSQRPSASSPMQKIPVAMAYLLSVVFTAIGLTPVVQVPIWLIAALIPLLALGTIVYVIRAQAQAGAPPKDTPAECWTLGNIYRNPEDPSLWVPARVGYGYAFNMANPWARRILFGLFGGIGVLVAFLIWALL